MNVENYILNAQAVIDIEIEAPRKGRETIVREVLEAIELKRRAVEQGRVVVMGVGKSRHIGKKLATTLASAGTPAISVHPAESRHGNLGMIAARDLALAFSQWGKVASFCGSAGNLSEILSR